MWARCETGVMWGMRHGWSALRRTGRARARVHVVARTPSFRTLAPLRALASQASPTPTLSHPTTAPSDGWVRVTWPSGKKGDFHPLWLRDHCRCPDCYHPVTKQRLLDTFSIPADVQPKEVVALPDGLRIVWPDQHTSLFPWTWLERQAYEPKTRSRELTFQTSGLGHGSEASEKQLWGAEIASVRPTVEYDGVMQSDSVVLDWLNNIDKYGFSFVSGVPATPEATEALVRRIAFIRETHYGGFWDFTSDLAHGDTAYTDIALGAHTDTTYFTDPAGLQLFHLLHHYSPTPTDFVDKYTGAPLGGSSLLVDGFYAAKQLHDRHPELYDILRTVRFRGHSAGDDSTLIAPLLNGYSVFEHDPVTDALVMIRYNNSDRSALHVPPDQLEGVYEALRTWNAIITDAQTEYWFPLQPGVAMIFDNHRVLHGRSQFVGSRRLCGAYVPHDDYRSRLSVLRHGAKRDVWDEGL